MSLSNYEFTAKFQVKEISYETATRILNEISLIIYNEGADLEQSAYEFHIVPDEEDEDYPNILYTEDEPDNDYQEQYPTPDGAMT